jgi:multicomponent Na+:H+ antiporter subunit D
MPVVGRAFFSAPRATADHGHGTGLHEAPLLCVLPPVLTAAGCVVLFFYAGDVYSLVQRMNLR